MNLPRLLSVAAALSLAGAGAANAVVYFCGEQASQGFSFDQQKRAYARSGFNEEKFKLDVDFERTQMTYVGSRGERYSFRCVFQPVSDGSYLGCTDDAGYMLNFRKDTGEFILAKGFGFLDRRMAVGGDSISVSYGRCDAF